MHLSTNDNVLTRYVDLQHRNGTYRVGDFMTKKEHLHVVKPTTPVDEGILLVLGFVRSKYIIIGSLSYLSIFSC